MEGKQSSDYDIFMNRLTYIKIANAAKMTAKTQFFTRMTPYLTISDAAY